MAAGRRRDGRPQPELKFFEIGAAFCFPRPRANLRLGPSVRVRPGRPGSFGQAFAFRMFEVHASMNL